MMELDPVEGVQTGKPGDHGRTGPSRRETKGDKPVNRDETGLSRRGTNRDKGRQTWKS